MDREIDVYMDVEGEPRIVGRLCSHISNGHESASFQYDKKWLEAPYGFALEPALTLISGVHGPLRDRPFFGSLWDSAPEKWGRMLMDRIEARAAGREVRPKRSFLEIDYLLMADDNIRQGAVRFRVGEGEFLMNHSGKLSSSDRLLELLSASNKILDDKESEADLQLIAHPASALGGVRPKITFMQSDGTLAVAKFPRPEDQYAVELWSYLVHKMAKDAGIRIPPCRIETVSGSKIQLSSRFDRTGTERIPFLSAMSMLGVAEKENRSYLELADALRKYGASPEADLKELWQRILFNVLVSNVDDHLRNHAFLYDAKSRGWRLSPAYDINPVPKDIKSGFLSLFIDRKDKEASFDLVLSTHEYYGLKMKDVRQIVQKTVRAISQWKSIAASLGASQNEIDRMSSAFEHSEHEQAKRFV